DTQENGAGLLLRILVGALFMKPAPFFRGQFKKCLGCPVLSRKNVADTIVEEPETRSLKETGFLVFAY
ncbi:MAG: hypothetical protein SAK29_39715, partial [Scytonema sp. PMC 1069.18]|nr:hypothetical protein [Scytonema sp. PMC 1069.18]